MPELAEVEYYRKRWNPGLGRVVASVRLHAKARDFLGCDTALLAKRLPGARFDSSAAAAKQMLFRFTAKDGGQLWLGVHLGMTGELLVRPAGLPDAKAEHLILDQPEAGQSLVFADFRKFGRVQFHAGPEAPAWWTQIAPAIASPDFTLEAVSAFLRRRARAPIKAVLLMQQRFPGVGNWMADEILWRAAIHPARPCGELTPAEVKRLHRETIWVAKESLATIGETFQDPPASWLFPHRWEDGGKCPRTKKPLERATIGGRTTCWSPARQKLRG